MSTMSYVSMMLITANTLVNIVNNINSNDANNNQNNNQNNNNNQNINQNNGRAMFYQNLSDFPHRKGKMEIEKLVIEDPFSHKLLAYLLHNNQDLGLSSSFNYSLNIKFFLRKLAEDSAGAEATLH